MYGYIKPLKAELKIREYEHYRATYCGLCHALKKKYGFRARFLINYDCTLLAVVLSAMEGITCKYEKKRCIASPHKKKCICAKNKAIDFTATSAIISAYWKIKDNIADKPFLKGLPYRAAKLIYKGAYKKAALEMPWFDTAAKQAISKLSILEKSGEKSIDTVADTFANMLSELSAYFEDESLKRIAKEMFYHVGRIIYITDAFFDKEEDRKNKGYNPILLSDMSNEQVIATINCSLNTAINAWSLVKENEHTNLVLNVLTLGIPSIIAEKGEKK